MHPKINLLLYMLCLCVPYSTEYLRLLNGELCANERTATSHRRHKDDGSDGDDDDAPREQSIEKRNYRNPKSPSSVNNICSLLRQRRRNV